MSEFRKFLIQNKLLILTLIGVILGVIFGKKKLISNINLDKNESLSRIPPEALESLRRLAITDSLPRGIVHAASKTVHLALDHLESHRGLLQSQQ